MDIKILGKGCPKCVRLEQVAYEAALEVGVNAAISHVTDMAEIVKHVAITPGLMIDGVVKSSGRVPPKHEIVTWIRESSA